MSQCLRITFIAKNGEDVVNSFVQKYAKILSLEGVVQGHADATVVVVACGTRDRIEDFIEMLYRSLAEKKIERMEVEPFLKDRDYRGVFRIIE